jgi:hypothetical protein
VRAKAELSASVIGSFRTRRPVSADTALATAGAVGGRGGSPTPPMASPLSMTCASTTGCSLIRNTS